MTRWISDPLVFLFAGSMACAQSQPDATPAFEVASVKASASSDRPVTRSDPERFSCTHAALRFLIMRAWGVMPYNLSGPSSLDDTYYNIEAKIPPGTSKADSNLMLQRLLVERIGLVVRHKIREQTVYDLMFARGGQRLREPELAVPAGWMTVCRQPWLATRPSALYVIKMAISSSHLARRRWHMWASAAAWCDTLAEWRRFRRWSPSWKVASIIWSSIELASRARTTSRLISCRRV